MQQTTIKQERDRRGWTLDEVSARTGIHKSTISRLERGLNSPTYDTVVRLQSAFGLKPGRLAFAESEAAA